MSLNFQKLPSTHPTWKQRRINIESTSNSWIYVEPALMWHYELIRTCRNSPKYWGWQTCVNSVDPDQTLRFAVSFLWLLSKIRRFMRAWLRQAKMWFQTCKIQTILRMCKVSSGPLLSITKTCQYNIDPLKPHFYIVKLGFTGVYIIFVISAQKHRLWVLVRTASSRRF